MALQVWIDGVDRTEFVQPGSLRIQDEMNARNTLSCLLRVPGATWHVDTGDEIIVYEDGTITGTGTRWFPLLTLSSHGGGGSPLVRLFAGTVEDPDETLVFGEAVAGAGDVLDIAITAVDFNQLCDRFIVAEVYEDVAIDAIVTDLASYLAGDGVTVGTIDPCAVIARKLFSYVTLTEALNWASEQTGYAWNINYSRVLSFRAPDAIEAPFEANGLTVLTMRARTPRGAYRNRQYIRAGRDLTDPRVETFSGDGTRRTFNVAYPIGVEPTVTVNAVPATVGIKGVETGFAWYWNKDINEITQDDAETVLTALDELAVTYRGLFPILVQAQDDAAIAERQAAEGGSGLYEAIEDHPDLDDADMTLDTAVAKLNREGMLRRIVDFTTDEPGLFSGQLITIEESALQVSGQFLIQSVHATDISGTFLRWSVTAISGDALGGWVAFYQRLMAAKRQDIAQENESLLLLRVLSDTLVVSDTFATPVQAGPETRIGFAIIGQSEIGVTP